MKPFYIAIVAVLIALLSLAGSCKSSRDKKEYKAMMMAYTDSLKKERSKNGELKATIQVVNDDYLKMLGDYGALKGENLALKEVIDKNQKEFKKLYNAFILYTETTVKLNDNVKNTITNLNNMDTCYKQLIAKGLDNKMPIYSRQIDSISKWFKGNITMGYDTTALNISYVNEFEGAFGDKKIGFFKTKYYADITSKNPYTDIKTLRVYDDHPRPQVGKIIFISSTIALIIGLLL